MPIDIITTMDKFKTLNDKRNKADVMHTAITIILKPNERISIDT
jgi:hypothetical protein